MTSFGDFNLYEELEIPKESTPEEIKKAYKKLAMVKNNLLIFLIFLNIFIFILPPIIFRNGILTKIIITLKPLRNSKEFPTLILSSLTLKKDSTMTSTVKSTRTTGTSRNL